MAARSKPILGFAAGTPIRTPEGSKPIEDIKLGDVIVSRPEEAGNAPQPELRCWEWN